MSLETHVITDNLDELLSALPAHLSDAISLETRPRLLEIVLDLGRRPEARFADGFEYLSPDIVTREELDSIETRVGMFGDDNRAGIPATLHRISAMRNRRGAIVGLTLRVGRAVTGIVDILRDIIESGQSVLLMGRPGLGKTTLLREMARVLSDEVGKRVVIVDTSNEIAGDGDVPHPAIGRARRMQVARVAQQHDVMIEAVENHMPEVVVIDEIGRSEEALAARTIAERGVQLVATVHGNTLDNLLANPTLSDLIGGINAVTLSDEEARRRGTQKTVLERKAPPTFGVVVEMIERDKIAIRAPVADVVDAMLRGADTPPELRWRDEAGQIQRAQPTPQRAQPSRGFEPERDDEERDARGRKMRGREKPAKFAARNERYGRREAKSESRGPSFGATASFGASAPSAPWNGTVRNGGAETPAASTAPSPAPAARKKARSARDEAAPGDFSQGLSVAEGAAQDEAHGAARWEEMLHGADIDGESAAATVAGLELELELEEADWDEPELAAADEGGALAFSDAAFDPARVKRVYPFGVSRSRLTRAIKQLGLGLSVARTWHDADAVLMLSGAGGLGENSTLLREARTMGLPLIGVRGNTYAQILARLNDLWAEATAEGLSPREAALQEAREAVQRVLAEAEAVELRPQARTLRRVQHQVAERYHVRSYSVGREPQRRVRFLPATPGRRN